MHIPRKKHIVPPANFEIAWPPSSPLRQQRLDQPVELTRIGRTGKRLCDPAASIDYERLRHKPDAAVRACDGGVSSNDRVVDVHRLRVASHDVVAGVIHRDADDDETRRAISPPSLNHPGDLDAAIPTPRRPE